MQPPLAATLPAVAGSEERGTVNDFSRRFRVRQIERLLLRNLRCPESAGNLRPDAQQVKKRRSSQPRVYCARARKSWQFCLKMRHYCHWVLSCLSPPSTLPKCRRRPRSTSSGWGCLPDLSTPQPRFYPLRSMNSRRNLGYPPGPSATNVRKRCGFLLRTPKNWLGSPGFKRWPALSSQRMRQSPNGSMHLRRRSTGSNLST